MDNLTPLRVLFNNRATLPELETNCGGIWLLTANGERMRVWIANNGWLYINDIPFGVAGMPPAPHKDSHAKIGPDFVSPESIGAVNTSILIGIEAQPTPQAGKIPLTANDGRVQAQYLNLDGVPTLDDFLALKSEFEALKSMAILSENIALLNSKTLPDGVASLELTEK